MRCIQMITYYWYFYIMENIKIVFQQISRKTANPGNFMRIISFIVTLDKEQKLKYFGYSIIIQNQIILIIMTQSRTDGASSSFKIAIISALGNWVGDAILFPLDTISTRLKASKRINLNPFHFAVTSFQKEKLNLFKGVQLTFHAAFIPSLIYLTVYDYGMNKVSYYVHKYTDHEYVKLAFPFFVSSIAQLVTLFPYLPVDTVRTRIQMNKPQYSYKSFSSALKQIKEKEGIGRFYKSSKIFFVCKTLYTAIQFQTFEIIRYFVGPSYLWMILNTIVSTAFAVSMVNPLEVLITRYALVDTTKKKLDFSTMVKKIYSAQGIKGFYKGYPTQTLYNCIYALFWLPTYQIVRQKFGQPQQE